jgi:hypothetical protein
MGSKVEQAGVASLFLFQSTLDFTHILKTNKTGLIS